MRGWTIWTMKPWTGDKADCLYYYTNKGHAMAKLKGLRRAAWKAGSEVQYLLCFEGKVTA